MMNIIFLAWKSKGIYNFEFRSLHDLAPIIMHSGGKIAMRFKNSALTAT